MDKQRQATSAQPRPLIVTEDPTLLEDLLRLAAAAEVEVEVASSLHTSRGRWDNSPFVLVGVDAATAASALPRRSGVVLVSTAEPSASSWQRAVEIGAEQVVVLPDGEQWLIQQFADTHTNQRTPAVLVCFVGARGGAGASVLATSLALVAAHQGIRTLLVDADPLGGGVDLILGAEDSPGMRWPDLSAARGRLAPASLDEALLWHSGLAVLSWDRADVIDIPGESMRSVLDAGSRSYELMVLDLPRRLDEMTREALSRSTATYLVSPAEVRATASALRTSLAVGPHSRQVKLVVRGPGPGGLEATDLAEAVGLPLVAEFTSDQRVVQALERGDAPDVAGRTSLGKACLVLLRDAGLAGGTSAASR